MNKYVRPLRPTTTKNRYINLTRREVSRSMPLRGRGVNIRQRSSGVIIEARPGKSVPGTSGMVFRGEYNSGRLYQQGDVVKISFGLTSGVYTRTTNQSDAAEFPWLGGGWTQLSKLLDQWL